MYILKDVVRGFFLIAFMAALFLSVLVILGCPEAQNMMQPVVTEPADTKPPVTVGEVKKPEEKPAGTKVEREETPAEEKSTEETPPADTIPPTVVEVAWYGDRHTAQPLTAGSMVHPGDTVYTVIKFSEPMMHTVANDETARPVLYIVADGKTKRYKMLSHQTDPKSGEVQPLRDGTTEYLCKYTIPADTVGTLALRVGGATANIAGNRVTEVLVHTTPFTVTEPMVSEPVEPVHPGDFVGQVLAPATPRRHEAEPLEGVVVTIASGSRSGERFLTDSDGRYVFRNIEGDELHLLPEKEGFEPKEVIVHRANPTRLPDREIPQFSEDPQRIPGNILIGHAWPEEVRFLLKEVKVIDDLLLYITSPSAEYRFRGLYRQGLITVFPPNSIRSSYMYVLAHEIMHAHQHALSPLGVHEWTETPECKAYIAAREKDWKEFGKSVYDIKPGYASPVWENAANFCAYFWGIGRWQEWEIVNYRDWKTMAPNRHKWAEEWLTKK